MISAKIIEDSVNKRGTRITTFELEYPRMIHAELMTHRVFSRNSASSRAIPVSKVIELIEREPAAPVHWGKNQPGMQAKEELDGVNKEAVIALWNEAARQAVSIARIMNAQGAHKQVINRILEPFQHMKVVVTSTQWENWFWLRNHPDADPTIKALAEKMWEQFGNSPRKLTPGEWHMPYVNSSLFASGQIFYDGEGNQISVEQALMISASCCAQTSYRKTDGSLEKAEDIFKKLVESEPCHASPVEHQAQCFDPHFYWTVGTTHRDQSGTYWSGNFKDWIQYRQLIPNNARNTW